MFCKWGKDAKGRTMFVSTMINANMNLKKIAIQSLESSQINLDALYAIAPSCFTEVKGDDG